MAVRPSGPVEMDLRACSDGTVDRSWLSVVIAIGVTVALKAEDVVSCLLASSRESHYSMREKSVTGPRCSLESKIAEVVRERRTVARDLTDDSLWGGGRVTEVVR